MDLTGLRTICVGVQRSCESRTKIEALNIFVNSKPGSLDTPSSTIPTEQSLCGPLQPILSHRVPELGWKVWTEYQEEIPRVNPRSLRILKIRGSFKYYEEKKKKEFTPMHFVICSHVFLLFTS